MRGVVNSAVRNREIANGGHVDRGPDFLSCLRVEGKELDRVGGRVVAVVPRGCEVRDAIGHGDRQAAGVHGLLRTRVKRPGDVARLEVVGDNRAHRRLDEDVTIGDRRGGLEGDCGITSGLPHEISWQAGLPGILPRRGIQGNHDPLVNRRHYHTVRSRWRQRRHIAAKCPVPEPRTGVCVEGVDTAFRRDMDLAIGDGWLADNFGDPERHRLLPASLAVTQIEAIQGHRAAAGFPGELSFEDVRPGTGDDSAKDSIIAFRSHFPGQYGLPGGSGARIHAVAGGSSPVGAPGVITGGCRLRGSMCRRGKLEPGISPFRVDR